MFLKRTARVTFHILALKKAVAVWLSVFQLWKWLFESKAMICRFLTSVGTESAAVISWILRRQQADRRGVWYGGACTIGEETNSLRLRVKDPYLSMPLTRQDLTQGIFMGS